MKEVLKEGMFLIDDRELVYKVIEVFKNSAVVSELSDMESDISCEIMTFKAMENEGWRIFEEVTYKQ